MQLLSKWEVGLSKNEFYMSSQFSSFVVIFRSVATMAPRCSIRNCVRSTDLHSVPGGGIDDTRRKNWLLYCTDRAAKLKRAFVCSHHFSACQWVDFEGKKYLKHDAVPDQHLPGYVLQHAHTMLCPTGTILNLFFLLS